MRAVHTVVHFLAGQVAVMSDVKTTTSPIRGCEKEVRIYPLRFTGDCDNPILKVDLIWGLDIILYNFYKRLLTWWSMIVGRAGLVG
jgi:hypothetical protein